MSDDENTVAYNKKMKEISSREPLEDEKDGPTQSKSISKTGEQIEQAGIEETPAGQELADKKLPEPKEKTPEEMMQNPQDISDGHGDDPDENEVKDPLSVEDNDEQFESMKDKHLRHVDMAWDHVDGGKAKSMWEGLTDGAEHKITACMHKMQGKVDDPGAFCGSLASKVGYKAER
jgi:hypothetical protein